MRRKEFRVLGRMDRERERNPLFHCCCLQPNNKRREQTLVIGPFELWYTQCRDRLIRRQQETKGRREGGQRSVIFFFGKHYNNDVDVVVVVTVDGVGRSVKTHFFFFFLKRRSLFFFFFYLTVLVSRSAGHRANGVKKDIRLFLLLLLPLYSTFSSCNSVLSCRPSARAARFRKLTFDILLPTELSFRTFSQTSTIEKERRE